MAEWEPSTQAEAAMRDALRVNDQEQYFRILSRTELLLPISADALAGRVPLGWGTWTTGGRTHVLAFTSNAALRACLTQHNGPSRTVAFNELAATWPNPEWWLAVNPGLPIEGYLPAWYVAQLTRGDVRLPGRTLAAAARMERPVRARATAPVPGRVVPPGTAPVPPGNGGPLAGQAVPPHRLVPEPRQSHPEPQQAHPEPQQPPFNPANEVEQALFAAVGAGSTNTYLSTLLLATVLLPVPAGSAEVRPGDAGFTWRTEMLDGETCVLAFTSSERLADYYPQPVETVEVRFAQLIRHWPDEKWSLEVNPGTAIGARLIGSQIVALASRAAEVGLGGDAEETAAAENRVPPEPAPAPQSVGAAGPIRPTVMQKVVPPEHVAYYLERGYDRVSGFVHRADELAEFTTPARLIDALGLNYPGSPFSREAEEIYVLRWPAYRPNLYRIPYGGQSEAAMRAMEGWVIEQPPFRGNGFAPGDSGEVIAEFKVDSVRLPHGAQLWRIGADTRERIVAIFDSDASLWRQVGEV